jgi:hypothetical protein
MKGGVITTGDRPQYLNPLLDILLPVIPDMQVFLDIDKRGHWWNLSRTMSSMLNSAQNGEPVLICCDDVITVPDWRERWERIHAAAQCNIYCMASRRRHLFKPSIMNQGYITGCIPRGYYDWATIFIDQQGLMERVLAWFEAGGRYTYPVIKRQKHLDVVIQEYLIDHRQAWVTTVPCLFDHIGSSSVMNHSIGRVPVYVGDTIKTSGI